MQLEVDKKETIGSKSMNRSIQSSDYLEILTTSELQKRLKIGRTKLFELKRNGTLIPGHHFFQNGRVLRWVWGPGLIEALHENPAKEPAPINQQPKKPAMNRTCSNKKAPINLSY